GKTNTHHGGAETRRNPTSPKSKGKTPRHLTAENAENAEKARRYCTLDAGRGSEREAMRVYAGSFSVGHGATGLRVDVWGCRNFARSSSNASSSWPMRDWSQPSAEPILPAASR